MNKLTPKEKQADELTSVRLTSTKLAGLLLGCNWRNQIGPDHVYSTEQQREH